MIRKQLYITEHQNDALKRRANELGVSEAEVVRQLLNQALLQSRPPLPSTRREKALQNLLESLDEVAETASFPSGYMFRREELYEDREKRWSRGEG